jgi:hypothetical protein
MDQQRIAGEGRTQPDAPEEKRTRADAALDHQT